MGCLCESMTRYLLLYAENKRQNRVMDVEDKNALTLWHIVAYIRKLTTSAMPDLGKEANQTWQRNKFEGTPKVLPWRPANGRHRFEFCSQGSSQRGFNSNHHLSPTATTHQWAIPLLKSGLVTTGRTLAKNVASTMVARTPYKGLEFMYALSHVSPDSTPCGSEMTDLS